MTLFNMVNILWIVVNLVIQLVSFLNSSHLDILPHLTFDQEKFQAYIVIATIFAPFLLVLLHDRKSFGYMLFSWPFFLVFMPTMVSFFAVYSFSRTYDLTWGNRPSEKLTTFSSQVQQKRTARAQHVRSKQQQQQPEMEKANEAVKAEEAMSKDFQQKKEENRRKKLKDDLRQTSRVVCFLILIINIMVLFLTVQFRSNPWFITIVAFVVFIAAGVQMFLALIFIVKDQITRFARTSGHTCWRGFKRICCCQPDERRKYSSSDFGPTSVFTALPGGAELKD